MKRILKAFGYTFEGLSAGLKEPAFREEFILLILAGGVLFFLPFPLLTCVLILTGHILTLIIELLNTGLEKVCDLASPEYHILVKRAKDMGSAAVFLTFVITALFWGFGFWQWLG